MSSTTKLSATDVLPLTCSRSGSCCHGKLVRLNPWELAHMAKAKGMQSKQFRDQYCEWGGAKLRFNGAKGWNNLTACSQYIPNFGCSVHVGRPLACRLFPLGRQRQGEELHYIYHGKVFPCMEGCPEVMDLPQMSVEEYVTGQATQNFELAQDAYLEVMQKLADDAFALFLETGLAKSGDQKTLKIWQIMGLEKPEKLVERLGAIWVDRLMVPPLNDYIGECLEFSQKHYEQLIAFAQEQFGEIKNMQEYSSASIVMMGLALHLGRSLGANPEGLSKRWITIAKKEQAGL